MFEKSEFLTIADAARESLAETGHAIEDSLDSAAHEINDATNDAAAAANAEADRWTQ